MEVKHHDNIKKELYLQMREHKHCIQIMTEMDTIQKVKEEHSEVFSPTNRA